MSLHFGSSGIRGRYPEAISPSTAFQLGRLLSRKVDSLLVLGLDARLSGPTLKAAFLASALESRACILDYGLVPTPAIAFETRSRNASAGLMITASHNPPEYNGFKIFNSQGEALRDEKHLVEEEEPGQTKTVTIFPSSARVERCQPNSYMSMLSQIRFERKWKVVVDSGNGAACGLAEAAYSGLLDKVTSINSVPIGSFPARGSEPTRESEKMLSTMVVETRADVGIAFDGDGDRMFVVDEKGKCHLQDRVLGSYIAYLSKKSKGPFLVPLDTSMAVDEVAGQNGAQLVRGPVGDALLLQEMKRCGAKFGGEPSGAWIHYDKNPTPDGILSGLLFLKSIEEAEETVSEQVGAVPTYHIMRQSLKCKEQLSRELENSLAERLRRILGAGSSLTNRFGLRVSTDQSWVLVRESGTEPVMRVTGESKNPTEVRRIMRETIRLLRQVLKS